MVWSAGGSCNKNKTGHWSHAMDIGHWRQKWTHDILDIREGNGDWTLEAEIDIGH